MTKIIVGLSRKRPGPEQFSSDGFHLTVELEKDISNPKDFHSSVRVLFGEVKAALDAEIAHNGPTQADAGATDRTGLWNKEPSRPAGERNPQPDGAKSAPGGNGSEPISDKQTSYLFQLASRGGMKTQAQIGAWLRDNLGVDRGVYDLTKAQASQAIEKMKTLHG